MARKSRNFTDASVDALADFARDDEYGAMRGDYWDAQVPGLVLRVGVRKLTWSILRQKREHGTRRAIWRTLGTYPTMNVAATREAATVVTAEMITGTAKPGKHESIKFGVALDQYLDHLRRKAERAGKPARGARMSSNTPRSTCGRSGTDGHSRSANPAAVAGWHLAITKSAGPVSANHCCRVIRAAYRRAARLDRSLPLHCRQAPSNSIARCHRKRG